MTSEKIRRMFSLHSLLCLVLVAFIYFPSPTNLFVPKARSREGFGGRTLVVATRENCKSIIPQRIL